MMIRNKLLVLAPLFALCVTGALTQSAHGAEKAIEEPSIKRLGDERYQVGQIIVDKANLSFTLSGRVLRTEGPLEFLVVKTGGSKGYESLLELDTTATEFNVACILVGMSTDGVRLSRFHFDEEEVIGPPVEITVQWQRDGKTFDVPISNLLYLDGNPVESDEWRYTGSFNNPGDGVFMPELSGILVGFVHDPDGIIDHRSGIGVNEYGSISGNTELLPEIGMSLTVTFRHVPKP
jgi:hypothetical protein